MSKLQESDSNSIQLQEGELKKMGKLQKEIEKICQTIACNFTACEKLGTLVTQENRKYLEITLLNIAEQATKEFPLEDWEIEVWLSEKPMEYIMDEQAIEIAKWVKKWLRNGS